jgi:anaerobic magnesium-protoporphyrin IX monomethyl ester cyclase
MKTITLVNPSKGFNTGIIPLGLASISAYLKKYGDDIKVTFLDANCQDIYKDFKITDVVAITAVTQDIENAIAFAKFVKSYRSIPVILGGVHISTYRVLPESFDVGVIGEGEETMLELLQAPDFSISTLARIKGICYNNSIGKTHLTEPRPLIDNLDAIPLPDRDMANMEHYMQPQQIIPYYIGRSLTMITSRGCPFNCVFCSTKIHWQKFRAFSAEHVIEEIELMINKYNVEIIHIFDDLFITDKKRLEKIHDYIVEKGINKKVKFMCLVRADMVDDKTMQMLKDMNVVVTGIGMESGCPRTLEYLKRRTTTIEKNRAAIELSNKYGIPTMGSFMIGNPGETKEELLQTLKFIHEYRYSPYLSPVSYMAMAFPGTEFWKYAIEKGLPVDTFDHIMMDIPSDIEALKGVPLLTDIPLDEFFAISQLIHKETRYGLLKRYIFLPNTPLDYLKAYAVGMYIEKNPITGFVEVSKIISNFLKYKSNTHT